MSGDARKARHIPLASACGTARLTDVIRPSMGARPRVDGPPASASVVPDSYAPCSPRSYVRAALVPVRTTTAASVTPLPRPWRPTAGRQNCSGRSSFPDGRSNSPIDGPRPATTRPRGPLRASITASTGSAASRRKAVRSAVIPRRAAHRAQTEERARWGSPAREGFSNFPGRTVARGERGGGSPSPLVQFSGPTHASLMEPPAHRPAKAHARAHDHTPGARAAPRNHRCPTTSPHGFRPTPARRTEAGT